MFVDEADTGTCSRLNESPRPKAGKSHSTAPLHLDQQGLNENPHPKAGKSPGAADSISVRKPQ